MRVAVLGGTGLVGAMVVEELRKAGHDAVVTARSTGVDVTTGKGLDAALAGVEVVVDVSNVVSRKRDEVVGFFEAAAAQLFPAAVRAGVRHHVVLSIVGIDGIAFPYYQGKVRQEELALASGVPVTVLRATQFHEFPGQVLRSGGRFALVPRMRVQPIAAREVAEHLVQLVGAEPVEQAADLAGPEVLELTDMARAVLKASSSRRLLLPLRLPGKAGRAMAGGALLPSEWGLRWVQTFDKWLAS